VTTAGAFDWTSAPLGPGVEVVKVHPGGLAALAKPPGVLAHPNRAADRPRSLLTAAFDAGEECYAWPDAVSGAPRQAWLLHRLDSATSGVVLVATRPDVAAAVREAFAQRRVTKTYLAVVLGHPRERRALWRDTIDIQRGPASGAGRGARARSAAGGGGQSAEAAMRVLRLIPGPPALAVLELEPHTGRTHQLRHQCARRHLPILGDQNYGNFRLNREFARKLGTERLFLHARAVQVEFSVGGAHMRFAAEVPPSAEFGRFLPR
jgi:23S rRNA-/tRNA-specific pseudouridylate synthase